MGFRQFRCEFDSRAERPLPTVRALHLRGQSRVLLGETLARFQLGETGEGRVVAEAQRSRLRGIDDDYRACLTMFVAEEGRHALLLGNMVRALGGKTLKKSKGQWWFTKLRGLMGVRLKLLVLFAAEVVAIVSYGALADALPPSTIRKALSSVVDDERMHLRFHSHFFRTHLRSGAAQALLFFAWGALAIGATALTAVIERRTLRSLGVGRFELIGRAMEVVLAGFRGGRTLAPEGPRASTFSEPVRDPPSAISRPLRISLVAAERTRQLTRVSDKGLLGDQRL